MRETRVQSSLEEGLKEGADFVKDVECKVYFCTGRRCPQANVLIWPLQSLQGILSTCYIHHLQKSRCSCLKTIWTILQTTSPFQVLPRCTWNIFLQEWQLQVFRPTPDMHDYAVRRPNCLIELVQKVYNSLFSTFTGPQSQPKDRWRVNCCTHLWYLCLKFPLDKLLSIFPSLFTLFFRKLLQILSYILSL